MSLYAALEGPSKEKDSLSSASKEAESTNAKQASKPSTTSLNKPISSPPFKPAIAIQPTQVTRKPMLSNIKKPNIVPKVLKGKPIESTVAQPPSQPEFKHKDVKHIPLFQSKSTNDGYRSKQIPGLSQEYDPFRPNDYDAVKKQLKEFRGRERQERMAPQEDELEEDSYSWSERESAPSVPIQLSVLASSLQSDTNGDEAYLRRLQMSQPANPAKAHTTSVNTIPNESNQETRSPVLVLYNMADRGAVDDALEGEIRAQCSKYGTLLECLIVQVPEEIDIPEQEAVRVYVRFENVKAAQSALEDMNGRSFDKRRIVVEYFPQDCFEQRDFY